MSFMKDALRTESKVDALNVGEVALWCAIKGAIAATEALDALKKKIFYNKEVNTDSLFEELETATEAFAALAVIAKAGHLARLNDSENYKDLEEFPEGLSPSNINFRLLHAAIGIYTEAGELLSALEKQMRGEEIDMVNVAEELGDIDWYKAIAHDETGIPEEVIRDKVIAKLKKRYGEKFSSEAAINRDVAAERVILEGSV